jgi:biotin transport system substrate-specific component
MTTQPLGTPGDLEEHARTFTPAVIARNAVFVMLAVSAAAQIHVPMADAAAPFTLQTLAVVLAGPLAGARAGTLGLVLYLLAGALGLPVFAAGGHGWEVLAGPTGGFLWLFLCLPTPLAHLARRLDGSWSGLWFGGFLGAHLVVLLGGLLWLSVQRGDFGAFTDVASFLPGAVLKSMMGVLVLRFTPTHVTRSARRRRPRIGPDQ